ncbi:metallophosphoesterase [Cereibacter sphaeroides]|uniref:metallophosphoesterase n=1 Tax=Cereibacter sphaeroides TaxID=1063 RepID=UPI001F48D7D8|nr:metallophosphoesterase [Cereibacter sphaeroides]MCE6959239.1 metallophosphoesterase [Cereibacter sphaeroides]MCE6972042.1 metallophosphoesterase [Cereibacter sphaeroides]
MTVLDIVPDLHGNTERLRRILQALDRERDTGRHVDGRSIAFLGDYIDRGPDNLAVLSVVEGILERGEGIALMGNHELNALLFHTEGVPERDAGPGYLRRHSASNLRQHATFLAEAPVGSRAASRALGLMLELPLFHERPGLRLVHACWDDAAIATVKARRPDGRLKREDLEEIAWEETDFARAVVLLCKGPEIELPAGAWYHDTSGHRRDKSRTCWWRGVPGGLHELVVSVPDLANIPDHPVALAEVPSLYPADAPAVIFGHYQLRGEPQVTRRALCLDYPAEAPSYRWDGEEDLEADKLVLAIEAESSPAP